MFGVVRPCRHRLRGPLFGQWMAHLCGLCLTLRDLHGQNARLVTNYDGLLVSVLTEAQNPAVTPHRTAGPCALRGFKSADVLDAAGSGARLAATVSLVLAAGKLRDHIQDGGWRLRQADYRLGRGSRGQPLAAGRRPDWCRDRIRHVRAHRRDRQAGRDRAVGRNDAARRHRTHRDGRRRGVRSDGGSGRPAGNAKPLARAGRSFGRIAHLIDAVEDLPGDRASGSYNPLLATGTTLARAREHCDGALGDLSGALCGLELAEPVLAESLLVREVGVAVDKVFADLQIAETAALASGWTVRGLAGGGLPGLGLPCMPVACRRRRRGREGGRCSDCCSDGCCDGCCDGCEACGDCADCCSSCDCSC